jgi:hypothetical protein
MSDYGFAASLYLIVVLLSAIGFAAAWQERRISIFFYGLAILLHGVVPFFHLLFARNQEVPPWLWLDGAFISIGAVIFFFLGETAVIAGLGRLGQNSRIRANSRFLSGNRLTTLIALSSVVALFGFLGIFLAVGFDLSELTSLNRMELRLNRSSILDTVARMMSAVSMVAIYLTLKTRNKMFKWVVLGLFGVMLTLNGIVFAGRYVFLYLLCPLTYFLLVDTKKSLFWLARILPLFLVIIIILVGVLQLHRWTPNRDLLSLGEVALNEKAYEFAFEDPRSDLNLHFKLLEAIRIYPAEQPWLVANTYKTMLLFWLPSSRFPELKKDTMYYFAEATHGFPMDERRLSNHPSLIGDLYINFGYFWWLGAFLWGVVIAVLDILRRRTLFVQLALGSTFLYFFTLAFRGSVNQPFVHLFSNTLFILLLFTIISILPRKKCKRQQRFCRLPSYKT